VPEPAFQPSPFVKTSDRETRRAYAEVHLCVALWGLTAILGRLITLPAGQLVAWRMFLVSLLLAVVPQTWRGLRAMSPWTRVCCGGIGVIVAAHWFFFYSAIKIANASVAVACLGLAPAFAAVLEPAIMRRRFERAEFLLGALSVPGVLLIAGGVPLEMRTGLFIGLVAAALGAVFTTFNKRLAANEDPFAATGLEMAAGAAVLGIPAWWGGLVVPAAADFVWLAVLSVACTLLPLVLWLRALRHVTAFGTLVLLNLEPVYAVVLAAICFQEYEQLTPQFYVGTAVVLGTVLLQPRLRGIGGAGSRRQNQPLGEQAVSDVPW